MNNSIIEDMQIFHQTYINTESFENYFGSELLNKLNYPIRYESKCNFFNLYYQLLFYSDVILSESQILSLLFTHSNNSYLYSLYEYIIDQYNIKYLTNYKFTHKYKVSNFDINAFQYLVKKSTKT